MTHKKRNPPVAHISSTVAPCTSITIDDATGAQLRQTAAVQTRATLFLDAHGIAWEGFEYEHDPAAPSYGIEAAEALGLDPAIVFKTLVARLNDDKGAMALGIVPVTDKMSMKGLARAAGAKRAVMASVPDAERTTGYVAGGISPFGLRKPLPTLIDETAEICDRVYVSGGRRGFDIAIDPADLIQVLGATAAAITQL